MNGKNVESALWLTPLVLEKGFSVQFRGDHVHVELGTDFKIEPGGENDFWSRLKKLCDEHDTRRILVEGFVPGGERGTGEVVAAGLRTAVIPHLWLAFHLTNFVPSDRSKLFEVIAGSRGVRVKFFADKEPALRWLRNNSPQ